MQGSRGPAGRASRGCDRPRPSPGRGSRRPARRPRRSPATAARHGAGRNPRGPPRGRPRLGRKPSARRRCVGRAACRPVRRGCRPRTRRSSETSSDPLVVLVIGSNDSRGNFSKSTASVQKIIRSIVAHKKFRNKSLNYLVPEPFSDFADSGISTGHPFSCRTNGSNRIAASTQRCQGACACRAYNNKKRVFPMMDSCIPAPRSRLPSLLSCPLGEGRP